MNENDYAMIDNLHQHSLQLQMELLAVLIDMVQDLKLQANFSIALSRSLGKKAFRAVWFKWAHQIERKLR